MEFFVVISVISLVVVLCGIAFIYHQQERVRSEFKTKMQGIVDQVNDASFYQYNYDKQQAQNIENNDKNVGTLYESVTNMQNNVKMLEKTAVRDKSLSEKIVTADATVGKIRLGDKFSLSGVGDAHANDGWLRLFDKTGQDYNGGMAMANLWTRDNAHLNGTTNINGRLNANERVYIRGGKSDMNPHNWGTHFAWHGDERNYIRGDTEIRGHVENIGKFKTDGIKVGHNWGDWTNNTNFSAWKPEGKAGPSFGGPQHWSHFTWFDNNVYIRPGKDGASILMGDVGNPSAIQMKHSWFPYYDGNTYIRPGDQGKSVFIGDWLAPYIQVGNDGAKVNMKGDVNVSKKLYFKDGSFNTNPADQNNSDPYYLEKVTPGGNQSELRLTINDDWDEKFVIYGDSCRTTGCGGEGVKKHEFRADGYVWHAGNMYVEGAGFAKGGFHQGSDSRIKDNIKDISPEETNKLSQLKAKQFTMKEDPSKTPRYGFIAQDVEKVYPNIVSTGDKGVKHMSYNEITPLVVSKLNKISPDEKTLCLGDTCVNEQQLKKLLQK